MLFTLKNSTKVARDGFTAFLYNQKKDYPALNTVYVDCHKSHDREYVKESHRLYFVIDGGGIFYVGNDKYDVKKNDVIVIEPKIEYSYEGKMKLFEVNYPATDSSDAVKV